jgi:hypothetical protein
MTQDFQKKKKNLAEQDMEHGYMTNILYFSICWAEPFLALQQAKSTVACSCNCCK